MRMHVYVIFEKNKENVLEYVFFYFIILKKCKGKTS